MANYLYTNKVGEKRRRACEIKLYFPDGQTPSVTFTEQDRIVLADGSAELIPVLAQRVISIDDAFMQKVFRRLDIESGEPIGGSRSGAEIFKVVFDAITDVFIETGSELEAVNNSNQ